MHGKGDLEAWKKMQKKSLCSGFNDADSSAIIAWNKRMQELVRMDEIAKDIRYGKPVKETAALGGTLRTCAGYGTDHVYRWRMAGSGWWSNKRN